MENHRSTATVDRSGRASLVPWESIGQYAPAAFTLAGVSLLASLVAPASLSVLLDRAWLVGIALVGLAVVSAALGLLGLHRQTEAGSPVLAAAGAASATTAGLAGLVVLGLTGLTGAAMHLPSLEFSVGKRTFVVLSLTMAAGYALSFLCSGTGLFRSTATTGRVAWLLTAGGIVLLVPVVGGLLQLVLGIALPAWVVFASLGLVAVDTVAVGFSLRSS